LYFGRHLPQAFTAVLRVGEFTYREANKELGHSFPLWYLTKRSIKVAGDGTYMELTIPAFKTDPFRKGFMITIAATQDEGCPVRAMKKLQANNRHQFPHAPLFVLENTRSRNSLANMLSKNYNY